MEGRYTTAQGGGGKAAEGQEVSTANVRVDIASRFVVSIGIDDLICLCTPRGCHLGWMPHSALDVWGEGSMPYNLQKTLMAGTTHYVVGRMSSIQDILKSQKTDERALGQWMTLDNLYSAHEY